MLILITIIASRLLRIRTHDRLKSFDYSLQIRNPAILLTRHMFEESDTTNASSSRRSRSLD